MSFNGSGTFQINTSGQPVVTGTVISSSAFNALTADLATGLSTAITKDGQTATTVRISFAQGINSSLATDTSSGSTGSIFTAGGVGIAKALYVGTTLNYGGVTLSAAVTGTGKMVLDTSPTLVTPVLGAASATSVTVGAGAVGTPSITTTGDTNTGIFFPAADTIAFTEGGAEAMRIDSSGNVGIGTSSPSNTLHVVGSELLTSASAETKFNINNTGTGGREWWIASTNNSSGALGGGRFAFYDQTANAARLIIDSSGIVTMGAYGAGAATFSSTGVISSVSDETWKIKDGVPIDPDSMLNKLEPGYWYYNDEKKETFGTDRQLGFYAQNVNAAIGPEAAPTPEEGKPWGYYDRSVLAVTVMSLQKALATIESLTARIAALEA
jgi:hypothetical protein